MASSFRVRRHEAELIHPSNPTPHEYKELSVMDGQYTTRYQARLLLIYRSVPEKTIDPAMLVRDSLARVLVSYYPLAGRLKEGANHKLVVECNGEGAVFIESDAEFSVEEIGIEPHSSSPYYGELIYDVPGSEGLIGCPLLLVQVTRLQCGGFAVGVRANHVLMDGMGMGQFLKALAEFARGATSPSVPPVWQRELLSAREPPHPDSAPMEVEEQRKKGDKKELGHMISRSFFFGTPELSSLRGSLPEGLQNCSTFDLLASFLWRSLVMAFNLDPEDKVRLSFAVDIWRKLNPALTEGYYGNAVVSTFAVTTAGMLRENPLEYAVSLVREAKSCVNNEYVRSYIDLIAQMDKPSALSGSPFAVSDLTKTGMAATDFGWGKPVFAIPKIILPLDGFTGILTHLTPARKHNGEELVMVPLIMPELAMERMADLIDDLQVIETSRR